VRALGETSPAGKEENGSASVNITQNRSV